MFYIQIPLEPIKVMDPDTDKVIVETSSSEVFRAIFKDSRIIQHLDTFSAYDLRKKLISASPGDVVGVRDEEHAVLKIVALNPTVFNAAFISSPDGIEFLRAVVYASSKEPIAK